MFHEPPHTLRKTLPTPLVVAETCAQQFRTCFLIISLFLSSSISSGCTTPETPNMLAPRGPAAAEIAHLWWLMFWMAVAVFSAVMILLFLAIYHARRRRVENHPPFAARSAFLVISGVVVPGIILGGVLTAAVRSSNVLLVGDLNQTLTIEVTGHQWWWEVHYPDFGILTANEIHIPTGETVVFKLTSRDVIHSFWVPQLHGKIDVIDGKIHTMPLVAGEPGIYRGICAEFCGTQHSFMAFSVIAVSPDAFAKWVAERQQVAVAPTDQQHLLGRAIFVNASCDRCHFIEGDFAPAPQIKRAGPALTHLADRRTLGAGTVENNASNLARWILDPHQIKPGVHMPAAELDQNEVEALVAYLLRIDLNSE